MRVRRLAPIALAIAAVGCGGSLKEPDAGPGSGQLGAISGGTGVAGASGADSGPTQIVDAQIVDAPIVEVRPPDEPCRLEVPVMAIAGETCRFEVPVPECSYADRSRIGVQVGGVEIPRDSSGQDGWDYDDPGHTLVRINGPACDAVTRGDSVTIVYRILLP